MKVSAPARTSDSVISLDPSIKAKLVLPGAYTTFLLIKPSIQSFEKPSVSFKFELYAHRNMEEHQL